MGVWQNEEEEEEEEEDDDDEEFSLTPRRRMAVPYVGIFLGAGWHWWQGIAPGSNPKPKSFRSNMVLLSLKDVLFCVPAAVIRLQILIAIGMLLGISRPSFCWCLFRTEKIKPLAIFGWFLALSLAHHDPSQTFLWNARSPRWHS